MSGLPPVDLAAAFGSTRSAGLTGLLPTKTPQASENREESSTQTAATADAAPRAPKKTSKQPAASPPAKPKAGRPRAVIVYVTPVAHSPTSPSTPSKRTWKNSPQHRHPTSPQAYSPDQRGPLPNPASRSNCA